MMQEKPFIPDSWSRDDLEELVKEFREQLQKENYEPPLQTEGVVILSGPSEINEAGEVNEKSPENISRINYGIDMIRQIVSKKSGKPLEEISGEFILKYGPSLVLNGETEQLDPMREIAEEAGFPAEKIELVDCGVKGKANTKTQFEAMNTDPRFEKKGHLTYITTSYHSPRVARTADKLLSKYSDYEIIGVPFKDLNYNVIRKILGEAHRIISYSETGDISRTPRNPEISLEEEERFLAKHYREFVPITANRELLDILENSDNPQSPAISKNRIGNILEQVETKVLYGEKNPGECDLDSQKILLSSAEPLSFATIAPIIEKLKKDSRCNSIGLITDNVAGQRFAEQKDTFLKSVRDPKAPVLADAMKTAEKRPYDIALVPVDPMNSPNAPLLFGGKSVFGAKKTYFIATGWLGVGGTNLFNEEHREQMEKIDGIFCADDMAKKILMHQLPDYPPVKIIVTGTPVVDALEPEKAEEYMKSGRQKLGLDDETFSVLYAGSISPGENDPDSDLNHRINEETFKKTLESMIKLAQAQPDRKFALLIRPHPRDPNGTELFEIAKMDLPDNLRVVPATVSDVSIQEATYGSDMISSISSTENFLAPLRGKHGVFLSYEEPGFGMDDLKKVYSPEIINIIDKSENISIIRSADDFITKVGAMSKLTGLHHLESAQTKKQDSVDNILNNIFTPKTQS